MEDTDLAETTGPLFTGRWEDGRPKSWPTLQLRVRGRPFDVYCDHPSDVTLDGYGIPVVAGIVADKSHLAQGWMAH